MEGVAAKAVSAQRTVVTFQSLRFNNKEPRPYFINPCCFGDDVGRWLIDEFKKRGHEPKDEPGQEDFGWYIDVCVGGLWHCFVIGSSQSDQDDLEGEWVIWLERAKGFWSSIFGGRERGISPDAIAALEEILKTAVREGTISNVKWHRKGEFEKNRSAGSDAP